MLAETINVVLLIFGVVVVFAFILILHFRKSSQEIDELKENVYEQQDQINDLKREVEELKQKLNQ